MTERRYHNVNLLSFDLNARPALYYTYNPKLTPKQNPTNTTQSLIDWVKRFNGTVQLWGSWPDLTVLLSDGAPSGQ